MTDIDTATIMILAQKLQDRIERSMWVDGQNGYKASQHDLNDLKFVNSVIKELENQTND